MIQKYLLFFLVSTLSLIFSESFCQSIPDIKIIERHDFVNESYNKKREVRFLFTKSKNPFLRYNPVSLSLGGLMFVYQKYISVQIGANCPYEVSCSEFSKRCIQQFGLIKGIALSSDRLMRCTRLSSSDISLSDFNEKSGRIMDDPHYYKNCIQSK